jgi:translation initiation factor IF-3
MMRRSLLSRLIVSLSSTNTHGEATMTGHLGELCSFRFVEKQYFATVPMQHGRSKRSKGKEAQVQLPLKNDQIRAKQLRVVFPEEGGTRILPLQEAREEATRLGLDLVLASPNAEPPVARIVSWEKMIYSMRQKQKAQERATREHKKLASPKEIRIGCHIAPHDLEVKMASARKILQENHQVLKVSVVFRGGREIDPAKKVLDSILDSLDDIGKVKDPKHLQKPQMNRWAVQLEPIHIPP